ncbi:MAG: type I restriction-modification enzyme R subunit C-terminal domain-containing protein [Halofilum sp. (in: g-proteobacteria)]|nr:type I restriction-modification enzyme R subunit C-terminal domain-containing protein [Halofilum sp. (in: g-proteobacteria)]
MRDDGTAEVPKTLIFAKSDSHADDVIRTAREVFDAGNAFCKKVTYRSEENADAVLSSFRNDYSPRIAVTVDMIATGTDVKPIECVLFMRDVKSRTYYTQMVGRGTRSLDAEGLRQVTREAKGPKEGFVLVDAVGVTDSEKMETGTLERTPSVSTKDLVESVAMGQRDPERLRSLAGRLARFAKRLDDEDAREIREATGGPDLQSVASELLAVDDPDRIAAEARTAYGLPEDAEPDEDQCTEIRNARARRATAAVTGRLNEAMESIRRRQEQVIDEVNPDAVLISDWTENDEAHRRALVQGFAEWVEAHRDELDALTILYSEPQRRGELTREKVREVLEALKRERPDLAPAKVWAAYAALDEVQARRPEKELAQIIALIRRVTGWDEQLTRFDETVRRNFKRWIFGEHAGNAAKFTEEQRRWLEMIRDHIATSLRFEADDLDYHPFDAEGGRGRMHQLFGERMNSLIEQINEEMVA